MTKRSSWCEFDKETRKYIKKRDKERCNISKDYEFALFIKNGKTYLYQKGENVGGYCKHFECTYDFRTDSMEYTIDY